MPTEVDQNLWDLWGVLRVRDYLHWHGEVIEQAAGGPVGRVHRTDEAPGVGQQCPHLCCAHLLEEGAPARITNNQVKAVNIA